MGEVPEPELGSMATDGVASIERYSLSLNGATVELCSLGASVSRFLVPNAAPNAQEDAEAAATDDVVLGFQSPHKMLLSKNPPYFGVIVGRVANRIANGRFELTQGEETQQYQLEPNDDPNHLHGGTNGFSSRIWSAEIVDLATMEDRGPDSVNPDSTGEAVKFTLVSEDGEEGYPGKLLVTATYYLQPANTGNGVKLCLEMKASLQGTKSTPINLAQHSYFNLSRHDDPVGILDHKLTMYADKYTPVDNTGIPTREVVSLDEDSAMDWRKGRLLRQALVDYGVAKAGLTPNQAKEATREARSTTDVATSGPECATPGAPYGFDHNYVISRDSNASKVYPVATLEHSATKRKLTVRTDAPGVQLYTANYLDGVSLPLEVCKDGACYGQWQGVCLETQHFPNSVMTDETASTHADFSKGRCVVLTASNPNYSHYVEYELEYASPLVELEEEADSDMVFQGSDSEGRQYASLDEMWKAQGVYSNNTAKASWYDRAADYYEENCPASLDGVLGGFARISDLDLVGSRDFVQELESLRPSFKWSSGAACECGAGIGRVTKGLLLPMGVTRCDLVESSSRLICAAPEYIGDAASKCRFLCTGLQEWDPPANTYSVMWIQWVFCYLTDTDAVIFLRRCAKSLVDGGVIVLKENTCNEDDGFVVDVDDASLCRSVPYLVQIAKQAGLKVRLQRMQDDFPDEIYPVPMIALEVDQE